MRRASAPPPHGDETPAPDPLIQAVEGAGRTPCFRGLTYLVLENPNLKPYGNHLPNLEVEVFRGSPADTDDTRHLVRSVCLIPAEQRMGLRAGDRPQAREADRRTVIQIRSEFV